MDNDLYFMRPEEDRERPEPEDLPVYSQAFSEPLEEERSHRRTRFSWPFLAAWLIFALGLGWFGYAKGFSLAPPQPLQAASIAPVSSSSTLKTERIADLKVGLRVLAQTPETPEETPPPLEIPDPSQWRLFTLEQTKKDGGILRIELLRPAVGVASAVLTEEDLTITTPLPLMAEVLGYLQPAVDIPVRTAALGAELGIQFAHKPDINQLLIGKSFDLDLPEMGAVGEAKIVAIAPCPEIEKGQGRVITGRFIHQAANVVDVKVTGETEPIGTTDNHPFWSEDRQDYVPAGELKIGEALRTVNGSQTYVQFIRPRGPPEDVYNLEVEGAHTYYVGASGILVHNSCFDELSKHGTIDPSLVRFSQNTISPNFKNGGSVLDMAKSLGNGLDPKSIKPIRLVEKDGLIYSLDNRRLAAFRLAGVNVPYVKVKLTNYYLRRRFTTKNEGISIFMKILGITIQ